MELIKGLSLYPRTRAKEITRDLVESLISGESRRANETVERDMPNSTASERIEGAEFMRDLSSASENGEARVVSNDSRQIASG